MNESAHDFSIRRQLTDGPDAAPHAFDAAADGSRVPRAKRLVRNRAAWIAAAVAAVVALFAFGGTPLSWALPLLIFVGVAHMDDGRRIRRAWLARHQIAMIEETGKHTLGGLDRAARTAGAAARLARSATNSCGDSTNGGEGPAAKSHGLVYLVEDPERDTALPQRRSRRMPQEMLYCNLGQVLDLSRGGMRVRLARNQFPEPVVNAEIRAPDGPLRVKAALIWTRIDDRTRDAGFRFVDLPPDSAQRITAICMQHRCQATMSRGDS